MFLNSQFLEFEIFQKSLRSFEYHKIFIRLIITVDYVTSIKFKFKLILLSIEIHYVLNKALMKAFPFHSSFKLKNLVNIWLFQTLNF